MKPQLKLSSIGRWDRLINYKNKVIPSNVTYIVDFVIFNFLQDFFYRFDSTLYMRDINYPLKIDLEICVFVIFYFRTFRFYNTIINYHFFYSPVFQVRFYAIIRLDCLPQQ